MALTKEQFLQICEEETDRLFDGKKALNINRGSISFTVQIENGKVSARIREKEIENAKKQ